MIINRIQIYNYGRWHDTTIPVNSRLLILYGHNEAGKTTLLSFIRGVLFGFPARNRKHYIPRQAKNYGGQLTITSHRHHYIIERRSGKRGGPVKIMDRAGRSLPNTFLTKLLGPIDRSTFDALFYFGNVNLKNVAKMKRKDLIQQIQKIGMANSSEWIAFRQAVIKHAKQLYSPTGYRPQLNQKLKMYHRLAAKVDQAKQQYTTYLELTDQLRRFSARKKRLKKQLKTAQPLLKKLNRERNDWIQYQKLTDLKNTVQQQSLRSGFNDHDDQRLRDLIDQERQKKDQLAVFQRQIKTEKAKLVDNHELRLYQHHLSLIKHLSQQFGDVRQQIQELALQRQTIVQLQQRIKQFRPQILNQGKIQAPLPESVAHTLIRLRDQINQLSAKFENSKAQQVKAEAQINASQRAHSIFNARKFISGVGLLTFNVSLIRTRDLKRSKHYQDFRKLYRHPKRLQKRLDADQEALGEMRQRVRELGQHYHYRWYPHNTINNWLAMQGDLNRFQDLKRRKKHAKLELDRKRQHLRTVLNQWTFLDISYQKNHAEQAFQKIESFVKRAKIASENNQALRSECDQLQQRIRSVKRTIKTITNQEKQFYRQRGIKTVTEFRTQRQRQQRLKEQQREYQKLSRQFGIQRFKHLNQRYRNRKNLVAKAKQSEQQVDHFKNQLQLLIQKQTQAATQLKAMVTNGSYDELRQRLANVRTEINTLAQRWLTLQLTGEWIDGALNVANRGRVPKIERRAQLYFRILTGHHYQTIVFNKTKITVLTNDQQRYDLHELSKGTAQQLYLALVFALAEVFGKDYPMPILIDDGFTDFDIQRRQAAWRLLKKLSRDLQVIYCTSDNQIKRAYSVKKLADY